MKACPTCKETYPTSADYCPRDGTALVDAGVWAEGTVVRGKYRILCKVGEGGMATVYKALHIRFDEMRALKVISPELATDPQFVKRFMQEAVITRKLQHPNAVRVEDIDEAEDGRPFIVMEYIQGQNLKELLQRSNSLSVSQVCRIAKQVAAALDAAHSLGMIHRDIKPSNIILTHTSLSDLRPVQEHVKVLDFGIAKLKEVQAEHIAGSTLTSTGVALGTPAYMSPEQARGLKGDQLDGRSDLYSLGIVMYQMLSGELPFKADTTMEMLIAHIQTPPPPIRSRHPEIPETIAAVVMRCLEKRPERRPPSAQDLVEEIELAERIPAVTVQPTRPARRLTPAAPQAAPEKRRGEGAGVQRDRPQVSVPALVIQASPAHVLVYVDEELSGQTGADGRLEFQRLPLGKRRIRLSSPGYRDHEQFLQINLESTARLTVALEPAGVVRPARTFREDIPPTRPTATRLVVAVSCALLAVVIAVVGFWLWKVSPHQPEPVMVSQQKQSTAVAPLISSPEQPNSGNTVQGKENGEPNKEKDLRKKEPPGQNKPEKPPSAPVAGSTSTTLPSVSISQSELRLTSGGAAPLTIRNSGSAPLRIMSIAVEGENAAEFWSDDDACIRAPVDPGHECQIGISFKPRNKTSGERKASLVIMDNAQGSPHRVTLWANTETTSNAKSPTGGTQNGTVTGLVVDRKGAPVAGAVVTLVNASIGFSQQQTTGPDGRFVFLQVKPAGGYSLTAKANGSQPFVAEAFDLHVNDLYITRPAITMLPLQTEIQEATVRKPAPTIKLSESVLRIKVGRSAELRLANIGTVPVVVESIAITGDGANHFLEIERACLETPIQPGHDCVVTVAYPMKPGEVRVNTEIKAVLEIKDNAIGSPHKVPLLGTKAKTLGIF